MLQWFFRYNRTCIGSHGLSIGSLGSDSGRSYIVQNVYVSNVTMINCSTATKKYDPVVARIDCIPDGTYDLAFTQKRSLRERISQEKYQQLILKVGIPYSNYRTNLGKTHIFHLFYISREYIS